MKTQRLRNLTTGRLHTKMEDIYEDVEYLTGEKGVMTHMLPNAFRALDVFLRDKVKDARYWDGDYDTSHDGEFHIDPMTDEERAAFWKRYEALPSIFEQYPDKPIVVVVQP